MVDIPIIGDAGHVLEDMIRLWRSKALNIEWRADDWWSQIETWRSVDCLGFEQKTATPKSPSARADALAEMTKHRDDVLISTEVGQHQMWAAQYLGFEEPNRWMTSGGLGTMGYGFPAAIGMQMGNPDACCIDVAGEASMLMNMQELCTAVQYRLPVKIMIINNQWMGMVRQWQELLHGGRYAESYTESLPDFVKLAESFGAKGIRATKESELDGALQEMLESDVDDHFRLLRDQGRKLLPDDSIRQAALRHAAARFESGKGRCRYSGRGFGAGLRLAAETFVLQPLKFRTPYYV